MDDLERLEHWLVPFTQSLAPQHRRRLAQAITADLRKDNISNIRRQVNPDGARWEKRKKTREVAKPIRYFYRARDGHEREIEMSSYRDDGDRIIGYDKEAGGIRTMLKQGMVRSMSEQHPSGSSAQKRRAQLMLTGFARNRFMRTKASPGEASVFFAGQAEKLASIHHFGLRDQVAPGGAEVDYPVRELLGISEPMREKISDMIFNHLAGA